MASVLVQKKGESEVQARCFVRSKACQFCCGKIVGNGLLTRGSGKTTVSADEDFLSSKKARDSGAKNIVPCPQFPVFSSLSQVLCPQFAAPVPRHSSLSQFPASSFLSQVFCPEFPLQVPVPKPFLSLRFLCLVLFVGGFVLVAGVFCSFLPRNLAGNSILNRLRSLN